MECLAKNSRVLRAEWAGALSWWKNQSPLLHNSGIFRRMIIGLVHCGAFKKVHVVENSTSIKKKKLWAASWFWIKLGELFWAWGMFCSSTVKIGPLFPRHNHKPMTHHLLWSLTRILYHFLSDQANPDRLKHDELVDHLSSDVAQILQQRDASLILPSKCGDKRLPRSHIFQQALSQSDVDSLAPECWFHQCVGHQLMWKDVQNVHYLQQTADHSWNVYVTRNMSLASLQHHRKPC